MTDAVLLRVYQNLLDSVAEQMGSALERTGYSPNIKERRDYSCAVFDGQGAMVAQAAHIPVHLGSTPLSVAAALERHRLGPGDVVILNDPYAGGTHLPDLTLVSGVFEAGSEDATFYVANRAHHADVGGAVPGSMALSKEIYEEGLRIPPVKLCEGGRAVEAVEELILANMRQPDERRGDLRAQLGALAVGEAQLLRLLERQDRSELLAYCGHLLDAAERHVRALLLRIPDGVYTSVDYLDGDGIHDGAIPLCLALAVDGDTATFDFAGTAPQVAGCLNANRAITLSAVFYVLRALAGVDVPANQGCLRPIELVIPAGSLLDPRPPAAVAGGNVETSQRLVDTILQAFAQALPEEVPASSLGTMNNVTLGGAGSAAADSGAADSRRGAFTYYETIGGGAGAGPWGPGASGVHCHMTNTRNTPVEVLEHHLPVRVVEYGLRSGSGGGGRHRGGDGIVRELEVLDRVQAALLTERRDMGPPGLAGGDPGAPGRNLLIRGGEARALPSKWVGQLEAGDRLRIETPGGGGWGKQE